MKFIFLNILGIAIVMSAGVSMAQYPNMTEEEIAAITGYTEMVPPVEFSETPAPCEPDDIECQALYLDVYGEHFHGFMTAQQHPSPIYSWEWDKCIANKDCAKMQADWEQWVVRAKSGGLDFSQKNMNSAGTPECIDPNLAWFGLDPAYKCYQSK